MEETLSDSEVDYTYRRADRQVQVMRLLAGSDWGRRGKGGGGVLRVAGLILMDDDQQTHGVSVFLSLQNCNRDLH